MNILGIDSSGLVASAAIVSEDAVVSEFTVNNKQTHSQTLLPMIEQVVKMSGMTLQDIDAIAIAQGPGSFTGLRIGSATAKGLALANDIKIVPVPTLEGLAFRLAGQNGLICPLLDARRNQVYTGIYRVTSEQIEVVCDQEAMDIREIIRQVTSYGEQVTFLGDGVSVYEDTIREFMQGQYQFAPMHLSRQSAASVAVLGQIYYKQGRMQEISDYSPVYLRQSQAERERAQRMAEGSGAADGA